MRSAAPKNVCTTSRSTVEDLRPEMNRKFKLAIVGIGNCLAGDDGLGIEVVRQLRRQWSHHSKVLLTTLEGDMLAVSELLDQADRFIFVDAVAGTDVGLLVKEGRTPRAWAPSFHQIDINAVMASFKSLELVEPFPEWELWGVVIEPPLELRQGLSPKVKTAGEQLTAEIGTLIAGIIGVEEPTMEVAES